MHIIQINTFKSTLYHYRHIFFLTYSFLWLNRIYQLNILQLFHQHFINFGNYWELTSLLVFRYYK